MRFIIPATMFMVSGLLLFCPQTSDAAPVIKKQAGFAAIVQANLNDRRYDQIKHARLERHDNRRHDNRSAYNRHDRRAQRHDRFDRNDRHQHRDRYDRHDRKHRHVKHIDRHRHERRDHRRNSLWVAWPGFFFGSYAHTNCR